LLLLAIDALLTLGGDDELVAEARSLDVQIEGALPNETMRQVYSHSGVSQRARRF